MHLVEVVLILLGIPPVGAFTKIVEGLQPAHASCWGQVQADALILDSLQVMRRLAAHCGSERLRQLAVCGRRHDRAEPGLSLCRRKQPPSLLRSLACLDSTFLVSGGL